MRELLVIAYGEEIADVMLEYDRKRLELNTKRSEFDKKRGEFNNWTAGNMNSIQDTTPISRYDLMDEE